MISRCRGFTLLEMMMVLVLLGVLARYAVALVPQPQQDNPLDRLRLTALWASEQAQIEGAIYRLQLHARNWQVSAATGTASALSQQTQWTALKEPRARGDVASGELRLLIQNQPQTLPANLWFLPDGDMTSAELEYQFEDGETRRLSLTPTSLFTPPQP
ncbi:type II secretion system protein [Ewingella americana]|uniref:type II secretion system protein n=1 Tax=Ewingella americana TaxID=41202 RepID=UPI0012ADCF34|nr:type II secretion system protein [Ewingella americana]MRT02115.1 prepilin-type N-terminal cleavage/methylation domain-containing protein [Ewingella americana]